MVTHARAHTYTQRCASTHTHTHTYTRRYAAHTDTHARARMHACKHAHTRKHTHKLTHRHAAHTGTLRTMSVCVCAHTDIHCKPYSDASEKKLYWFAYVDHYTTLANKIYLSTKRIVSIRFYFINLDESLKVFSLCRVILNLVLNFFLNHLNYF